MEREKLKEKGYKAAYTGIASNLVLAFIKAIAGILGNSFALVADAIESSSDVLTSIVLLIGIKISIKPPDQNHPYGHGKAEPLASLFVSGALLISAFLIIYQAIDNITTPHDIPESYTLIVLGMVIFVKEFLFRKIHATGHELESSAIKSEAWHHRSDALTSAAAFIGITIALIGGPGYESADDWAALFAAIIIIINAGLISKNALSEIMDEAPSSEIIQDIVKTAGNIEGVVGIEKGFVRKMGFDYFIDLHVIVNGNLSVREGHRIAHLVKDRVMEKNKKVKDVLIHIEPHSYED